MSNLVMHEVDPKVRPPGS